MLLELVNMHHQGELTRMWHQAKQTDLTFSLVTFVACCIVLAGVVLSYILLQGKPVYLVDYSVYKGPEQLKVTRDFFMEHSRNIGCFEDKSLEFQEKILSRSGLGEETYLPSGIMSDKPTMDMAAAREEFETVMFKAVQDVLEKTKVHPKQIGVLVVNCSLFCPTPSLAAMLINHFKMRSSIMSYNLGGMGCSAGVIAIDLARQMLQLYPNTYALVVSTENITQNWYFGNDRSMLLPNCIFRMGGAAMLLSNKRSEYWRSKYELLHTVRTHLGANDQAYQCVFQKQDDQGNTGVSLSKELMAVAGESLKVNITTLGPLVLPISEQLLFFANLVMRKVLGVKTRPYIPDFKLAFDHICIHTGGRAVIDEIEKQLKLTPAMVEPSRQALYRYGNVSSSSIWYVLAYIESQRVVNRGDRVWQLAFGSGFKCNSAVWRALRKVKDQHPAWQ